MANRHAYPHPHFNSLPYANTYLDSHANSNRNSYRHPHSDRNPYTCGYPNTDGYTPANRNANRHPTTRNAHPHLYPNP